MSLMERTPLAKLFGLGTGTPSSACGRRWHRAAAVQVRQRFAAESDDVYMAVLNPDPTICGLGRR
ncbi:MAG: hypothetical protein ABR986_11925 [Methanomassiliicoccales archaeon]